jgi:arabinose-5-phosphate isomerase
VAITRNGRSSLGRAATVTLELGDLQEAGMLGLAPSTSTTVMLAMGDALALVTSRCKGFGASDFARFHPGGSLGRKLMRVDEVMRPLVECRVAEQTSTVRDVLIRVSRPGRRTGAIMLVNTSGQLTGLFTDSDLARLLEHKQDADLDQAIERVMTSNPMTVPLGTYLSRVMQCMAARKISEMPVVDSDCRPVGLVDITDLLVPAVMDSSDTVSPGPGAPGETETWRAQTLRFPHC